MIYKMYIKGKKKENLKLKKIENLNLQQFRGFDYGSGSGSGSSCDCGSGNGSGDLIPCVVLWEGDFTILPSYEYVEMKCPLETDKLRLCFSHSREAEISVRTAGGAYFPVHVCPLHESCITIPMEYNHMIYITSYGNEAPEMSYTCYKC